jgi:uncharacterized membrane protein YbhN (UPF0104 family)
VAIPQSLIREVAVKASIAIRTLAREPWRLIAGFVVTLAAMTVWAVVGWCTLAALGHQLPFAPLIAIVACAELMSAVPVSVQGIGVREFVFATALGVHGVSTADATLLGLLMYAQALGLTCAGGVITMVSPNVHAVVAHEGPSEIA